MSVTRRTRRSVYVAALMLPVLFAITTLAYMLTGSHSPTYPNVSQNVAGVACVNARGTANAFAVAVLDATKATPDYASVKAFGFTPPLYANQLGPFRELLEARRVQLDAKAQAAADGVCTDAPTAHVIDANGRAMTLPLVEGSQPGQPISGSQSNRDPRTVPVTLGTSGDKQRTNSWSELDDLYGDQKWYTSCTNANLGMNWDKDVPKFVATEGEHDNRFILAVNVSAALTDADIRQQAADDGNPRTGTLPVVRVGSIINTRHLAENRCDTFVDTRSMIRVSLGKVVFDSNGNFKSLEMDKGAFVDCHNLWRLPKSKPVPTRPTPSASTPPGTTPPGTTPPRTTPPTTRPPSKCKPPTHDNGHGTCVESKNPNQGAGHKGNVPTQVQGTNPPASSKPEPKPSSPPKTYTPPPPPVAHTTQPAPARTTNPPDTEAPQPSDPATGCAPAPGRPC